MIAIKQYINTLTKLNIAQSQLLFLMLVRNKNQLYETAAEYFDLFKAEIPKSLLLELREKGYLNYLVEEPKSLADYETTPMINDLFIDMYEDADEFLRKFPAFIKVMKGNQLVTMATTATDASEFRARYAEITKYSKEEHEEMMLDLDFAIKGGLLTTGLDKYLKSEMYRRIREMRTSDIAVDITTITSNNHDF